MNSKRKCLAHRMQTDPNFYSLVNNLTHAIEAGGMSLSDWTDALILAHEINQTRKLDRLMLAAGRRSVMAIMGPGRHNACDYKKTALDWSL